MENEFIKTEDLQVGDEVIVSGLDIRYLKILTPPRQRKKPTMWGGHGFSSIKCLEKYTPLGWPHGDRVVYFDFNYKKAWLVKRE